MFCHPNNSYDDSSFMVPPDVSEDTIALTAGKVPTIPCRTFDVVLFSFPQAVSFPNSRFLILLFTFDSSNRLLSPSELNARAVWRTN